MSETKFTPGPWKIYRGTHGFQLLGIGDKNGEGIADSYFNLWRGYDAEAEANAHLIAAAPEMYEALKPFALFFDACDFERVEETLFVISKQRHPDGKTFGITVADFQRVRAALQRARGETP